MHKMHSFNWEPSVDTDDIQDQAFPLRFCILQVIKNWIVGRPGDEDGIYTTAELTILCVIVLSCVLEETSPAGHAVPPVDPMVSGEGGEESEGMEGKEEEEEEEKEGEAVAAGDSQLPSTQDLFGGDSS